MAERPRERLTMVNSNITGNPIIWTEKRLSPTGRRKADRDLEAIAAAARRVSGNQKWTAGLDELRAALAALGGEDSTPK